MAEFSSPTFVRPMQRISSIDVLRALTMVLMVFINDIVTLTDIPLWLDHVERGVDGIGLADVVYPAFLFIVGLSIYFAVNHRREKGDSTLDLVKHVLIRSAGLLIMGALLINPFTVHEQTTGIKNFLWNPLCVLAFILTFNSYSKTVNNKGRFVIARVVGAILLITLVFKYGLRYSGIEESEGISHFAPQHWGILGGIG
jgi:heparan-alpha-glucosaminide N-acetyltransferase